MDRVTSINLSRQLLDSEFDCANNNTLAYCKALGWHKDSPGTQKALKKKGELSPSKKDFDDLAIIVEKVILNDIQDVIENNEVADFLCNCVAKHIQA